MSVSILCAIIGHRPDRKRAWHDTIDYRTDCLICGAQMVRERNGWKPFDVASDGNSHRREDPRRRDSSP